MSKFTPGPWKAQFGSSDWGMPRSHAVLSSIGDLVAEIHSIQPYCAGESKKNIDRAMQDMVNARLIAQAPAMYEALQKILAIKRTVDLNLFDIEAIHSIAEAALRAADGVDQV